MEKVSSSSSSSASAKNKHHIVSDSNDVGAQLVAGVDTELDPQEALRIQRKIDWHLMPLMCIMYLMAFADKTTLGQSAVMGLIPGAHLTTNQFNWLGTIFYLSYLTFQYPQNLALQRFPVGKWMSINIFIWSIALCSHAACHSFGSLFAVRFIMGMCEGAITPGFMIVTSMFYTRQEQTKRTGYWFLMNGFAIIILGFVAFGCIHIKSTRIMPWQWLMLITGIVTFIVSVLFWFFFPDSPTTAWFLTPDERIKAVQRVRANQAGIENKQFKPEQMIEALKDPKTWLFAFFSGLANIFNSLSNQRQIVLKLFGFNLIQTTLLGCVDGTVEIISIFLAVTAAAHWRNGRAYSAVLSFIPSIVGCILLIALPSHNKIGLLFSYWLTIWAISPFVVFLSWVGMSTSGHTKRITVNAIVLIAYGIGNAAGPFIWQAKYKPRNKVPFSIILACSFVCALTLLVIRWYLAAENTKREEEGPDGIYDNVYIQVLDENGRSVEKKVDKTFLDLTDGQNHEFRFTL